MPEPRPGDRRLAWVDALKGVALVWVFLNHLSERVFNSPLIGNPFPGWPPLDVRVRQLAPLHGHGFWDLPLNLFRYVGWTGDQGVGLFLFAAGFGLAWGGFTRGSVGWAEFARRRVMRLFPMWWVLHGAVLAAGLAGMFVINGGFLLSVIGLRVTSSTFYAYFPAWWFFTLLVQLYLVYPLLWNALRRVGPVPLLAGTAVLGVAARAAGLAWFDVSLDAWLRGQVFITRLPEFVLGMVFARALFTDGEAVQSRLCGAAGRLSALALFVLGNALALTWWGNAVSPVLLVAGGFGLLYPILACASSKNLLSWLGVHSLPIYLIHEAVIVALVPETPQVVTAGVTGRMAVAVVVAIAAALALERGMEIVARILGAARRRWGFRGLALRTGLALVAVYGVLILVELAVQRTDPCAVLGWGERPSLQSDERFGWHLIPNRTTRLRWNGTDYTVTANSLGFPGPEVRPARTPGSFRILVTGDGFTSAEGVDTAQAWPRLLERRLTELRKNGPVEVLNFAIAGYGPHQHAAIADHFAPVYRPDLILVAMSVDEFKDAQTPQEQVREQIGFRRPSPDGVFATLTLRHLDGWARNKLRKKLDARRLQIRGVPHLKVGAEAAGLEQVEDRLSAIRKAADAVGARLELVLAPAAVQVCGPERSECFPAPIDLSDPREFDLDLPQRRFREIATRLKIGTVDLRESLGKSPRCPHHPRNMYWTAEGHELVAQQLAARVSGLPDFLR